MTELREIDREGLTSNRMRCNLAEHMAKENITIRLEGDMLAKLDALTVRLNAQTPHVEVTRADTIRAVVVQGIAHMDRELGAKKVKR